jgi:tRNA-Thr(GGU) m(6)t(6)A37 methyltransferase TsaA
MTDFTVEPIGYVRSTRQAVRDDDWDAETMSIVLTDDFDPVALSGLADFSHVEVIFVFDQVTAEQIERGARHPRGREDWPLVGIFAQRGKNRPNRLGLTTCAVLGVDGRELRVSGLDAVDGTPVLDIKPVLAEFAPRGELRQPDWARELMTGYWTSS